MTSVPLSICGHGCFALWHIIWPQHKSKVKLKHFSTAPFKANIKKCFITKCQKYKNIKLPISKFGKTTL